MKKLLLLLSSSHHQHQKQGYHYIITEYYTCNTISCTVPCMIVERLFYYIRKRKKVLLEETRTNAIEMRRLALNVVTSYTVRLPKFLQHF